MLLRIFTEPHLGATYDDLLAAATVTEEAGFDAFFRSDHYLGGTSAPGATDAWITLAGLARETRRIRLGTLVSPVTFRLPGPLAISVAQVDAMSGGRVELGLGTGWMEQEHRAYRIPFPAMDERWQHLREQLEVVTGLWSVGDGDEFSFDGRHYRLEGAPAYPKPVQNRVPIIVGGVGLTVTPRLAARYADEHNVAFKPPSATAEAFAASTAACEQLGRDPGNLVRSAAVSVCCGEDDTAFRRRAANIGQDPDHLREKGVAGTVPEVAEKLRAFGDAGAERLYLQVLDLRDTDHIRLLGEAVAPLLG